METMRALRLEKFGTVADLELREVEKPHASQGQVLVEVWAGGINPSDVKNATGAMKQTTLPRTPGRDGAGIVVGGPASLKGAEVWVTGGGLGFTMDGCHAEYVLLPEAAVRRKPDSLTLQQAGSLGLPFITAWLAVVRAAAIRAGETILIVGASGSVGSAATQIAKWKGARVIGADRRKPAESLADESIDTSVEDLSESVRNLTSGKGADLAFDTVGGPMFEPCLKSLRRGGRLVEISSSGGRRVIFDLVDFYHQELTLHGVDSLKWDLEAAADILDQLKPGFDSGALVPPVTQAYSLEKAKEAYQAIAGGRAVSKLIITPRAV
jgi:NADPH:quinone reductase-like Zn-dependent oxidoreductase